MLVKPEVEPHAQYAGPAIRVAVASRGVLGVKPQAVLPKSNKEGDSCRYITSQKQINMADSV